MATPSPAGIIATSRAERKRRLYPSHVLVRAPDGGLDVDSGALAEQVRAIDRSRLVWLRGALAPATLAQLDRALLVALDLPAPG